MDGFKGSGESNMREERCGGRNEAYADTCVCVCVCVMFAAL